MDELSQDQKTKVRAKTPFIDIPAEECVIVGPLDPCTIVIFGASGDLTSRKLVPALYNLYLNDGLPKPYIIVGASRTTLSHDEFREKLKTNYAATENADLARWEEFAACVSRRSAAGARDALLEIRPRPRRPPGRLEIGGHGSPGVGVV